jgi:Uncharacterized protein conserved in bacteria
MRLFSAREQANCVDAKTSLKAYEAYYSTDDPNDKEYFLQEHIKSVRAHIKSLSEKDYTRLEGINSLDYVLMFIPIEPAFSLLMKEAKEIYNEAFEKNIILVTQTTLFVTLKTIQNIWKTEKRNENAILIAARVQEFLKKFEGFVATFEDVGKALGRAQANYDKAEGQLRAGKGNLLRRGSEIAKLGGFKVNALPDYSEDESTPLFNEEPDKAVPEGGTDNTAPEDGP